MWTRKSKTKKNIIPTDMHIGQIIKSDVANGIGFRLSLFVSGCTNHCPFCFQPETWDFDFGHLYTPEIENAILLELEKHYYDGLTILGGEPMEFSNQEGLISLIRKAKKIPNKSIWIYTGFLYEDFLPNGKRHGQFTDEILDSIDILVDGRFIQEKKDVSLNFRGSSNQRIIDMKETRKYGHVVLSPLNN